MFDEAARPEDGTCKRHLRLESDQTMNALAAYYVVIASEQAQKAAASPRYQVAPPAAKRSRIGSIVAALARPVRRTAGSAA
jgi:hypothetical protein